MDMSGARVFVVLCGSATEWLVTIARNAVTATRIGVAWLLVSSIRLILFFSLWLVSARPAARLQCITPRQAGRDQDSLSRKVKEEVSLMIARIDDPTDAWSCSTTISSGRARRRCRS
jgi:hypothetical protein